MKNLLMYLRHGFGLRKAFYYAFDMTLRDFLLGALYYAVLLFVLVACIKWALDALVFESEVRVQATEQYRGALEKVLANCFDDKAIQVGDRVYLCHLYDTGERI